MDEFPWKKINILLGLILICFLLSGCQKAKESEQKPEQKQEVKVQKEEVKQPEVKQPEAITKEVPKAAEPEEEGGRC
jgi:PBP1b-binding outer membrane lipoprotein LpoB